MIVRLALNYGGRQEILDAARKMALESRRNGQEPEDWTEQDFKRCLYDAEMTDPDMLIRTGGEMRLSNFLLWQLSYAELWFTENLLAGVPRRPSPAGLSRLCPSRTPLRRPAGTSPRGDALRSAQRFGAGLRPAYATRWRTSQPDVSH